MMIIEMYFLRIFESENAEGYNWVAFTFNPIGVSIGTYPYQPMNTFNDVMFINIALEALNVNNSALISLFNED
jgi:hypothetical protein